MSTSHQRSHSREPPSRPTTPLRASSRTSLRSPHPPASAAAPTPLASLEPAFAELADSMADLEANMMHLQLMHESLASFGENFAAFLYGLNVNAFCVDFPEGPSGESWAREEARKKRDGADGGAGTGLGGGAGYDPENTFM
jgi:DASH complex subunit DAM1